MAKIIMIAAIGRNNELGKNNDLIWRLKGDLKFFREQTINHKIVMGYNTFESLPGLLPKREHIILTHKNIQIDGTQIFNDFEDLNNYLSTLDEDIYVIGGASIYKLFIDIADELVLTEIDAECLDADVYFPPFDKKDCDVEVIKECEENDIKYRYIKYTKRPKCILSYGEYCEIDGSFDLSAQSQLSIVTPLNKALDMTFEEFSKIMNTCEKQSDTWVDPALEQFVRSSKIKKIGTIDN